MGAFLTALGLVFVAELGDKTQLVALGLGARHRLGPVLAGVAAGYAASTLLSVVIGGLLGAALPTRALAIAGGVLFLGFAAWNLRSDDDGPAETGGRALDDVDPGRPSGWRVAGTVAPAMFVAELGDKTMLATATLAAQGDAVLVWVGATIGIILSGTIGVLIGRVVGTRLPERAIRIGSSVLFALFGVGLIVANL